MKVLIPLPFVFIIPLVFSSASCFKINVNLPPEKSIADNSTPPNTTTPLPTPVTIEPVESEPIEPIADDWQISLTSEGGYANDGNGNFFADATGKLTYQKPRLMGELPPPCETKLSRDETERLKILADGWRAPNEAGRNRLKLNTANDDIDYKMQLVSGATKYELEFHGNTFDLLPVPNQNLVTALFNLREKACAPNAGK